MRSLCSNCRIRVGIYEFTDVDRKHIEISCTKCFDIVQKRVNDNMEKINEKNNKRANYQDHH